MAAGYIFNMDRADSIADCFKLGRYETALNAKWSNATDGTFADYLGMSPGDNVYFFSKRRIYGIGRLIKNKPVYLCHRTASVPSSNACLPRRNAEENVRISRWGCAFEPAPFFFKRGIDMDDALQSAPTVFNMLRAFWKVSFIKIDDFENQALKDALLYCNNDILPGTPPIDKIFVRDDADFDHFLKSRKRVLRTLDPRPFFDWARDGEHYRRESALECNLIWDLTSRRSAQANAIFGHWDYVNHQVIASPFKPIDYMDRMDLFGYEYINGFAPTILKYKVCELKKGVAGEEDLLQCMKYVEWIRDKYAHGDYSKIQAFLVAADFILPDRWQKSVERNYVSGLRDVKTDCWRSLSLVEYKYDASLRQAIYKIRDEE